MNPALLVEREPALVPFLRDVMREAGHGAVVASKSVSVRTLRRTRPATILIGPGAGRVRPLDAIRRIRRECASARVIVVAYRNDPAWNALARALGADVVLGPEHGGAALADALAG